jgi:hypothetical protein
VVRVSLGNVILQEEPASRSAMVIQATCGKVQFASFLGYDGTLWLALYVAYGDLCIIIWVIIHWVSLSCLLRGVLDRILIYGSSSRPGVISIESGHVRRSLVGILFQSVSHVYVFFFL